METRLNLSPEEEMQDDAEPAERPSVPLADDDTIRLKAAYDLHASAITAGLRKTFGDGPPDPEDVTQQAFQRLIERKTLDDIDSIKAFLWRTARNLILNEKKKIAVRSKYDFELEHIFFPSRGDNQSQEAVSSAKEELRAINEVLRRMPERRRRAFILHRIEGLTISETARRLRIARSAADRHILKAASEIQIRLAKLGKEDRS